MPHVWRIQKNMQSSPVMQELVTVLTLWVIYILIKSLWRGFTPMDRRSFRKECSDSPQSFETVGKVVWLRCKLF